MVTDGDRQRWHKRLPLELRENFLRILRRPLLRMPAATESLQNHLAEKMNPTGIRYYRFLEGIDADYRRAGSSLGGGSPRPALAETCARLQRPPHRPNGFSPEEMLQEMKSAGVDRAIVVPPNWIGENNSSALEAAAKYPDRFAVVGRFDAKAQDARLSSKDG